jgi:hypothetical protein
LYLVSQDEFTEEEILFARLHYSWIVVVHNIPSKT